ncbi:MAG: hypothetical protein A3A97_03710 [Candidatus Terrybacteria bacterium RIFCSPLOWO2_01_FULL_40_23]|uniref:Uncharacterized protein n=1 Tax=Candidatus Terrybacteria bacterium RIFCSPLOWO2_01_FULL_40_23 TaxID=1802366 RepID=A0A1G2PY98_9BACT|nr:MAG: hypothetical protein A3A97_03710 [Candidatus Terrybacteria bacterium RIFCSPLOWO2_01_FULL_40_23]
MQKIHIYIFILAVVFFLVLQLQINKMDRKLTCIYTQITALPVLLVPELRANQDAVQGQMDFVAEACHPGFIFSGGLFVSK